MSSSDNREQENPHVWGSSRLTAQYRSIGTELLSYEHATSRRYGFRSFSAFTSFREGVSFVPLAVLESYLEDLLDLDITESTLFIERTGHSLRAAHLSLVGLLGAVVTGLYGASSGASLVLSLGITIALALPFAVMWHFAPREGLARRVGFAQILSHEIARRRGHEDQGGRGPGIGASLVLRELLPGRSTGSARTAFRMMH